MATPPHLLSQIVNLADDEEDAESVDMRMWTQHRVNIKTSQSPHDPHNIEDLRSPSHDEIDEIPFTAPKFNESADTVTVPMMTSDVITSADSLLEVLFLEGPKELEQLPDSLRAQLRTFCHEQKTDWPSCVRTKWASDLSLCRTRTGNHAWFEDPQNGETLLAARYQYGTGSTKGQIVVVQQSPGCNSDFNQGEPAIVCDCNTSSGHVIKDNTTILYMNWEVWHPSPNVQTSIYARRAVELDQSRAPMPESIRTISNQKALKSVSREDAVAHATRQRKRPSLQSESDREHAGPTKRPRLALHLDPALLKADYSKTGKLGATKDLATGEILLRRFDGKLIALRCTECDFSQCESQQGLLMHLNQTHGIKFSNHQALEDATAIEVDEPTGAYTIPSGTGRPRPSIVADSERPPTRRSRRLATPPPSATPQDNLVDPDEPKFVFRKGSNDSKPRVRPLRHVNSAEKLFAHALAAGIAKRDTLILTVAINGKQSIQIVRGDDEDFQMVVDAMSKSKAVKTVAVVTAEDLDI